MFGFVKLEVEEMVDFREEYFIIMFLCQYNF